MIIGMPEFKANLKIKNCMSYFEIYMFDRNLRFQLFLSSWDHANRQKPYGAVQFVSGIINIRFLGSVFEFCSRLHPSRDQFLSFDPDTGMSGSKFDPDFCRFVHVKPYVGIKLLNKFKLCAKFL